MAAAVVLFNCGVPALLLVGYALTDRLGANPVEFVTRATGTIALVFLLASLAVTPLRRLTGLGAIGKHRRTLGLAAFAYAAVHVLTYVWLDQFFSLAAIAEDVVGRPFITVGVAAFVLMVPLAVTSTRRAIARLGGKRWQRIHRRVYLIAPLAVLHYAMLVKADVGEPLVYGAIVALLLGYRVVVWVQARRRKLAKATA